MLCLVLLWVAPARAAQNLLERIKDQEVNQTLRLKVGQSKVLRTPFGITRISVGNPEVADVLVTGPRELYITGMDAGYTNLTVWGGDGRLHASTVLVELDVTLLKEKLHQVLPNEKIAVYPNGKAVVLAGEVSSPVAAQTAVSVAEGFLGIKAGGGGAVEDPKASQTNVQTSTGQQGVTQKAGGGAPEKGRVINLMHVGGVQQVMVEVRVAEISRDVGRRIGINFGGISHSGNFGVSFLDNLSSIATMGLGLPSQQGSFHSHDFSTFLDTALSSTINAIGGWKAGGVLWTAFFAALKREGLGRILAEPNLVATSGQEAEFLAGGEFPIPVPQQFGTIGVEFKKFGVGLKFVPTVLDNGKIALKVSPEVSELDETLAPINWAGYIIPGLRVRRTSTQVEIKEGQTLAIAGLLSDNHRNVINKFPILGDIPILGTVFRSSQFQKNETELVVLVTPYLVKPTIAKDTRLPTDAYVEPNDYEFYLLGRKEGRGAPPPPRSKKETLPPGFGHETVR